MKNIFKKEIENIIQATHPITSIKTEEELKILEIIKDISNSLRILLFTLDIADGLKWVNEDIFKSEKQFFIRVKNQIPDFSLIEYIEYFDKGMRLIQDISKNRKVVVIINGAHNFLIEEHDVKNIRLLKNIINNIKIGENNLSIFLLSTKLVVPLDLQNDLIVLESPYPSREEIGEIIDNFLKQHNLNISKNLRTAFISALQGLTNSEIENLLYLGFTNDFRLDEDDVEFFTQYKKQIISKEKILEFIDLKNFPENSIGGLKNLKEWIERKKEILKNLDEAIKQGVDIPKGVLLFGMPGCGKSLTAKYTAKLMGFPLIRLDMGRIMGPYLGQSEENLRKAINLAEAISPSILWIDEVEKALAGVKGGDGGGTATRIFGTLLTWMQEKTKPVFVIATANDIKGIPPEFLRKGRFDEIFFVDFPKKHVIKEIFEIHLKNRGKSVTNIDFNRILNEISEGYSGADIEAIVSEAVERAFVKNKNDITTEDLLSVIKEVKPISETLKDKIDELRKSYKDLNAKNAD